MALEQSVKDQLLQYLELLEGPLVFRIIKDDSDKSQEMLEFVNSIAELTDKITVEVIEDGRQYGLKYTPSFSVDPADGEPSGIVFAGIPLGHEFSSLVLAILQVGGRAPKISDEERAAIEAIDQDLEFETFVSLTCHNCPDVVQNLNIMAVINPRIKHTMIEGGMFNELAEERNIFAVPTVFLNGEEFAGGRQSLSSLLEKLDVDVQADDLSERAPYDMLIVGGGPAGAAAAIYSARKGIRTGLVAEEFGGQVLDTLGIENFIGTEYVEGPQLMAQMRQHVDSYKVDVMENQLVEDISGGNGEPVEVTLKSGQKLTSKTAVIATGARWRRINIPGEEEFQKKGISYCPHCDGPLYEGQPIAVIGGGNSGIEAALDLAGMASKIYVLELTDELRADQVLQDRLREKDNVEVILNAQTLEVTGDGRVEGLRYKDSNTGEEHNLDIKGLFILVGLVPNTEWVPESIERNDRGEIIVDERGTTSVPGIHAAGDCTDQVYKQIVISVGSGATAALGAYDYILRQGL